MKSCEICGEVAKIHYVSASGLWAWFCKRHFNLPMVALGCAMREKQYLKTNKWDTLIRNISEAYKIKRMEEIEGVMFIEVL
jgi:hypothetical protein